MLNKSRHPPGFYILTIAETIDRMGYYGILSVLVLYLTKQFLFADTHAYMMFGIYTALAFATPVLGGYLADRFFGLQYSVMAGMVLIILGNLVLIAPSLNAFFLGLALVILGIGFFKGNATTQLGLCYREHPAMRDSGYNLYYMGMNAGNIIGPILFGFTAVKFGWHLGFMVSAAAMLIAGLLYVLYSRYFFRHNNTTFYRSSTKTVCAVGLPLLVGLLIITTALFKWPMFFSVFMGAFAIILVIALWRLLKKLTKVEQNRVLVFVMLTIFSLVVVEGEVQIGSSLTLYLDHIVAHSIGGIPIPIEFFATLEPIAVIVLAIILNPLFKYIGLKYRNTSAPYMMTVGLLLNGISFVIFGLSAEVSIWHGMTIALWMVVLGNVFLGAGDLVSTPAVMGAVEFLAPKSLQGSFMGIYFLGCSFAGYLSSLIVSGGQLVFRGMKDSMYLTFYQDAFWLTAGITFIVTIIAYVLSPKLKRMMETT
jgi:POT family proton-dependent oligopeptide transporter